MSVLFLQTLWFRCIYDFSSCFQLFMGIAWKWISVTPWCDYVSLQKKFNDVLVAIWQTCHKLGWGLQGSWWTLAAFQWVRASLKNPIAWLVDASGSMQENCIFVHMVYKAIWKICRPSELVSLQILKYKIWVSESTYEVVP
jgi:hypothetical protein